MCSDINFEDCKTIASRYLNSNDFEVENYEIKVLENDLNGYTCQYMLLIVNVLTDTREKKRLQCFCKTILPMNVIGTPDEIDSFGKEKFVYEYFGNDGTFAPKYLLAKDGTLILEDLTIKNYVMIDDDYLDIDHVKCTLKSLAKLHCNSLVYEERKGNGYKLIDEFEDYFQEGLHSDKEDVIGHRFTECGKNAVLTLVDLLAFSTNEKKLFKQQLKETMKEFYELINNTKVPYRCVCCHGDIWRRNLMFRYENGTVIDCKLIDFQVCRYLPPAHDVTYTIYHLADDKLRQESYDDLLNYYYETLTNELNRHNINIIDVLPKSEYEITCKIYLYPSKIVRTFFTSFSSSNRDSQKKLYEDPKKAFDTLCNDRTSYVTNEFKTNESYRILLTNVITNLKDALINRDVIQEDCHTVLKSIHRRSDYVLLNYHLKPFNRYAGNLGDYRLLETKILMDGREIENDFYVKKLPTVSSITEFVIECGANKKEYGFFKAILPKLSINEHVPKCYLFRLNDLAIFENLNSQGYVMMDKRRYMDYELIKFTLKSLAHFHGSFYVLEEQLNSRLIDDFPNEFLESFFGDSKMAKDGFVAFIKGTLTSIDLFYKNIDVAVKDKLEYFLQSMLDYVKPSKRFRNTLCHGDLWASNILYKFENGRPTRCKFVDYQSYRYLPPTHDVLMFLYLTTNRSFRIKYMKNLLQYYYEELNDYVSTFDYDLNQILPYNDYVECCKYDEQFAVCINVSLSQVVLMDSEQAKESFVEGSEKVFFGDRSNLIRKLCETDPIIRERIKESLDNLMELSNNNSTPIIER